MTAHTPPSPVGTKETLRAHPGGRGGSTRSPQVRPPYPHAPRAVGWPRRGCREISLCMADVQWLARRAAWLLLDSGCAESETRPTTGFHSLFASCCRPDLPPEEDKLKRCPRSRPNASQSQTSHSKGTSPAHKRACVSNPWNPASLTLPMLGKTRGSSFQCLEMVRKATGGAAAD